MKLWATRPTRNWPAERTGTDGVRTASLLLVANKTPPTRVIALHCSGSGARQWRHLGEMLGTRYHLLAPEYYGCKGTGPWIGTHAFTLADEASRIISIVDTTDQKVHLIGHSYGGGVALHMALMRPDRVASLTLYEPLAFHLLKDIGFSGAEALAEILAIACEVASGVMMGDYRGAAEAFVDYWSGNGAWSALRPELQSDLTHWMPKAPLDFAALIGERTEPGAYACLRFPVLIIRGSEAPGPTRLIADALSMLLPSARLAEITGAGHMGPLTHTAEFNAMIIEHLAGVDCPFPGNARHHRRSTLGTK